MLAIIHIRAYRLTFKGYHVHKQSADLMTALGNECVPAAIHIMLIISHLTDDFPDVLSLYQRPNVGHLRAHYSDYISPHIKESKAKNCKGHARDSET